MENMRKLYLGLSFAVIVVISACNDSGNIASAPDGYADNSSDGSDVGSTDSVANILTDPRDGHVYRTVTIRGRVWMAENLNYANNMVVEGSVYNAMVYMVGDRSGCYDGDSLNCAKYGRLYTWAAAVGKDEAECGYGHWCEYVEEENIQGVCPPGWHLPSTSEWNRLINAVGKTIASSETSNTAGMKLKSAAGWKDDGNGTDDYSFSVLPAGSGFNGFEKAGFSEEGSSAYFWTSSESGGGGDTSAFGIFLSYNSDHVSYNYYNKDLAFSVRCIKD